MTPKRYFYVMSSTLALSILLIAGGAFGGHYLLQKKSQQLTNLKIENKSIESQQAALVQAKKDIEKYSELNNIAKSIVPQDKDQAKTVREIVKLANENSVPIKSVTFQSSTLGTTATGATPSATNNTSGEGAATPKAAVAPSQLKAVTGIQGVYTLEIQVASASPVRYNDLLNFLNALENNRRTAHVTSINLTPNSKNRNLLDFSLTLNAYVKP